MSTYYYFACNNCMTKGGFLTRQAWGWGNFDIIDSFKFIAYHTQKCGEEHIRLISENNNEYEIEDDFFGVIEKQKRIEFLEETRDIFPSSNDWLFMEKYKEKDLEEKMKLWTDIEKENI